MRSCKKLSNCSEPTVLNSYSRWSLHHALLAVFLLSCRFQHAPHPFSIYDSVKSPCQGQKIKAAGEDPSLSLRGADKGRHQRRRPPGRIRGQQRARHPLHRRRSVRRRVNRHRLSQCRETRRWRTRRRGTRHKKT